MNFRSTSFSMNSQSIRYIGKYSANIANYQRQISSGQRYHRPSGDPVAFRQITSFSARLQELESESLSLKDAENKLNTSVSQLTEVNNLLTTAKLLAQQGVQALSQSERNALAVEAESLLNSLQDITKSKAAGAYLYGGTRSDVLPFEFAKPTSSGGTLQVDYFGAEQNSRAYVGEAVTVETFFSGKTVFSLSNRTDTLLMGDSGAKPGSGTDNLIGRATLEIRHTSTTYSGTSGIAAGTDSIDGDTIIGQPGTHTITINDTSGDGSFGTILLNDGSEFQYTNADTNLEVVSQAGDKIYVDTTSITPGFSGTVDITANGTLSVDGGATTTPIDFSSSQRITDSNSDRFVHIDSESVFRTGDDYLDFPGTSDVFQIVYELTQDLRNVRDLDSTELAASLDRRLGELTDASDHVLDIVGQQSASLQTLRQLEFRIQDLQLETETQLNNLQSTDIAETVLRLQNDQSLLEYTYAISSQIASISLIDFLR